MKAKRIFVVDDHPLVREWLTNLIHQQDDLIVCGEAESVAQARQGIEATRPEVAIVDLSLAAGSGLDLIKDLKALQPDLKMIVLSMHDEMLYAERALRAGARGYIMKRETTGKIVAAIREVLAGKLAVSDRVSQMITERYVGGPPSGNESPVTLLSDRELEIVTLIGNATPTREIAKRLGISIKTVESHRAHIKDKLNLTNATQLVQWCVRWIEEAKSAAR